MGVRHRRYKEGAYYEFMAGDRIFVDIVARVRSDNTLGTCHLTLVDGPDVPGAGIMIDGDSITFKGKPENQYQRTLAVIRTRLVNGLIPAKLCMPYGYVQDGVVIAIWYSRLNEGNVPGAIHATVTEFALQGHDLPAPLLGRTGDSTAYLKQYWELMRAGNIIELGERVVLHPGSLWLISSNTDWPRLVFDEADGMSPLLPANEPYLLRLASDPAEGNLDRTRTLVNKYLQAGRPPENLSEFFADFVS